MQPSGRYGERSAKASGAVRLCGVGLRCGTAPGVPAASTETPGVSFAVPYLKAATVQLLEPERENPLDARGKHVVVIGAGYTSSDCVATAIRQGCASVTQLIRKPAHLARRTGACGENCRKSTTMPWRMPWRPLEKIPGGMRRCSRRRSPTRKRERLIAVKTVGVRWIRVDGILMQEELPETEQEIPADLLLIANGFAGCEQPVLDAFGLEADRRGNLCLEGRIPTGRPTSGCSRPGICAGVRRWWCGPSLKAAPRPGRWMNT